MKITDYKKEELSNAMQQYYDFKINMLDTIVFFQLGDFYEMFFDDAVEVSNLLELTLTGKSAGLKERVPMAGIPVNSVNEYIKRLMAYNKKVAIVSQEEGEITKGKLVQRHLTKIVTPGTYLDTTQIDYNFTASICELDKVYVAYGDIATGDMFKVDFLNVELAINEFITLGIKEIIDVNNCLDQYLELLNYYHITVTKLELNSEIDKVSVNEYLINYFKEVTCNKVDHLKPFVEIVKEEYLQLSINTQKQLELVTTIKDNEYYGSFFHHINHCSTAMGRRLLKSYILNPLIKENEIIRRQNLVTDLLDNFVYAQEIDNELKKIYDFERLIGKIADLTITPKEIIQLRKSIGALPKIKKLTAKISTEFSTLSDSIDSLEDVYSLLDETILPEPAMSIKDGYVINDGFNKEIDELRNIRINSTKWLSDFEAKEREKTNIKNLKVRYNKIFGYFIEVSNSNVSEVPENYIRKQTMANCERYITDELKEAENKILNAADELVKLEQQLFFNFKNMLKLKITRLQSVVYKISFLDVISCFAKLAQSDNFVKPMFNGDNIVEIRDCFHPVIKKNVTNYINNDIILNENKSILLITGPNMSGKSTYMRQLVITIILAQMGSYVPASYANLKIYDKIFTRIGASDDVALGKSTFMVEMSETAEALRFATKNSLIIFDELGRGTSTYDGIALAHSILEYVHDEVKCDTLFSTHYHELIDLENSLERLKNIHVKAKLNNDILTFYHRVEDGGVEKSFGIDVAKLAHLPNRVVVRANHVMEELENSHIDKAKGPTMQVSNQMELELEILELKEKLAHFNEIDINNLTPLEIVNKLNKYQDK